MIPVLQYTLSAEGSSDDALRPILEWALREAGVRCDLEGQWADAKVFSRKPESLGEEIRQAILSYPCHLLFVHRDTDNQLIIARKEEIEAAVGDLDYPPHVCVIPRQETETWLLIEERAIRQACGHPQGKQPLSLPSVHELEERANAKEVLFESFQPASELTGRRWAKFDRNEARRQVSRCMNDFHSLRRLSAFQIFEGDLREAVKLHRFDTW